MKPFLWVGGVLAAVVVAFFVYIMVTDDGPKTLRETARAVKDLAFPEPAPSKQVETWDARSVKPATTSPSRAGTPPAPRPAPTAEALQPPTPPAAEKPAAMVPAPPARAPAPRRTDFYVPGSLAGWTTVDLAAEAPVRLRAGGLVSAVEDASGPEGVQGSVYERTLVRARSASRSERVMPTGPYLALIGRVCTGEICTPPFVVGSTKLLCPADLPPGGRLQLWTNNYIQVDGTTTLTRYSTVSGGYAVYAEAAPALSSCDPRTSVTVSAADVAALSSGRLLRKPEFVVSSSQISWKPFFLPLDSPLQIRASGEMQPSGGARVTGPDGIAVPASGRWVYPGTTGLAVGGENRLFDARFPYQALIGRMCGDAGCEAPFLVGSGRTLCPSPGYTDRLELWINHIVRPETLLGSQMSLSILALELQGRRGQYRFEIERAPNATCGS
jgi:hypothetical protein